MDTLNAAELLRTARRRAGLTQRELARRAGTSQSVLARIETGTSSPTVRTLERLLTAAGQEARVELSPSAELDPQLLDDVDRILAMTPEERLAEVAAVERFVVRARRR